LSTNLETAGTHRTFCLGFAVAGQNTLGVGAAVRRCLDDGAEDSRERFPTGNSPSELCYSVAPNNSISRLPNSGQNRAGFADSEQSEGIKGVKSKVQKSR
jgi:hypothetical protein